MMIVRSTLLLLVVGMMVTMIVMMSMTTACTTTADHHFLFKKKEQPSTTTTTMKAQLRPKFYQQNQRQHRPFLPPVVKKNKILILRGGSPPPTPPTTPPFRVAPKVIPTPSSSKTFSLSRPSNKQQQQQQKQQQQTSYDKKEGEQQQQQEEEDDKRVGGVSAKEMMNSFLTRESRNAFVARVYGILSCQLTFTALVCTLFGVYPPLTELARTMIRTTSAQHPKTNPLVVLSLGGIMLSTISWFTVCASPTARRQSPQKWWWLTLFTIGEAISVGCVSSLYDFKSVVLAMGATAVATITVSAYTILQSNPKYDLSQWGTTLSSWAMILLVYILVGILQNAGVIPFELVPYNDMIYSAFASILFSLYLAHHTKLIVGGKHAMYRMNEKDYVFGAMALYVDIVNIFLVRYTYMYIYIYIYSCTCLLHLHSKICPLLHLGR